MKIGIDIMGGDHAPVHTVSGAIKALEFLEKDSQLVLIGDEPLIRKTCEDMDFDPDRFIIVHAPSKIEMEDHPAKSFQEKQDSGIVIGFKMLASGEIDGFASAGNTGAMLVGSMTMIKTIDGIDRPAISSPLPRIDGDDGILLDVGIYPDAKPENLYQYGLLGSVYAKGVLQKENPTVGLLNIGSEPGKGSLLAKSAYQLMEKAADYNFIGNMEGSDLFRMGTADVIVCEGFTGNVVLKQAESFYRLMQKRQVSDEYLNRFNFDQYGGTPVLGINKPVIIGHGVSKEIAIKNMILHTRDVINANISEKIKEFISHDKS
ncbi:MAG: phosphate--acyl-ACP acyltransferase [Salinivirgaceae bacterium]